MQQCCLCYLDGEASISRHHALVKDGRERYVLQMLLDGPETGLKCNIKYLDTRTTWMLGKKFIDILAAARNNVRIHYPRRQGCIRYPLSSNADCNAYRHSQSRKSIPLQPFCRKRSTIVSAAHKRGSYDERLISSLAFFLGFVDGKREFSDLNLRAHLTAALVGGELVFAEVEGQGIVGAAVWYAVREYDSVLAVDHSSGLAPVKNFSRRTFRQPVGKSI